MEEKIKEIYELSILGFSTKKVAIMTNTDQYYVQKVIKLLSDKKSRHYNMKLYNKIIFANAVANLPIYDKDLLNEIIDLINYGFSILEIAILEHESTEVITETLKALNSKNNCYYNPTLYANLKQKLVANKNISMKESLTNLLLIRNLGYSLDDYQHSKLVKKVMMIDKLKQATKAYIKSNGTLVAQDFVLKYRFHQHLATMISDEKNKELVDLSLTKEEQQQILTLRKQQLENQKEQSFNLNITSTSDDKKIASIIINIGFWIEFLCTFRLSLADFADLMGIKNIDQLKKALYLESRFLKRTFSLMYLFENPNTDPAIITDAKQYLNALKACQNDQQRDVLLSFIDDREYYKILKSNRHFGQLTDKEKKIVIEFKLKYALKYDYIPFSRNSLKENCPEEYQEEMRKVSDFNSQMRKRKK